MNKKGFTLVELLLVITLLAIIGSTASFGIAKIININNNKKYEKLKYELETASSTIIELKKYEEEPVTITNETSKECKKNNKCIISSKKIIEEGLINEEDLQGKEINILITWIDGEKIVTIE